MIFNGKSREHLNCFEYEEYWHAEKMEERFPYDISCITREFIGVNSVWDARCGNGRFMKTLDAIFSFDQMFISDVSSNLLVNTHFNMPFKTKSHVWDIKNGNPPLIDEVDCVLAMDIIEELDENALRSVLRGLKGKKLITRTKIALKGDRGFWGKSELLSVLWDECNMVRYKYAYPKGEFGPYVWFFCSV